MTTSPSEAVVELSIPSRPEYVGVARLAILGVASRMRFSYDEVEDIRLAVGEACTTVLDRLNGAEHHPPIRIRCIVEAGRLVVEVRDNLPAAVRESPADEANDPIDETQLGSVLIRILMDEVQAEDEGESGGHLLRMVKYVAR